MSYASEVSRKLTPNFLLKKLKRKLGVMSLKLPFSDEQLLEIFYEDTLPVFSIFFPASIPFKVDLGLCKPAHNAAKNEFQKAYHIDFPESINVIEIESLEFYESMCNNYWAPPLGALDSFDIFNSQIMQNSIDSMMSTPVMHGFIEPNILILDDYGFASSSIVTLNLLVEHSRDLSTLKFTYMEKIMALFCLDAKIALYSDMKHHDKIDTTVNQVDLKIDNWENAEQEREDLLEKWDEIFLSHRSNIIRRV